MKSLKDVGFEKPTSIQVLTIPELLSGRKDIIALAQTGTGKTAAFGIPMLQKILTSDGKAGGGVQYLILAPTRELCLQITGELKNYSAYIPDLQIVSVYGGSSIENQIQQLKKKPQIVCATPGRLLDLYERKVIDLSELEVCVLDEADEMLNMGFRDDIETILKISNPSKNIWMFSATMPSGVKHLTTRFLKNPVHLQAEGSNKTAVNIVHQFCVVHRSQKYPALKRLLDYYPDFYGIIFCRTKTDSQKLSDELVKDGYSADALHGDLTQSQREWVMKRFRNRSVRILVATDVAARGIDVDNLTHVIHFQLPDQPEVYTHRSGRTARAGRTGISLAFIGSSDRGKWREIQKHCHFTAEEVDIPSVQQILQNQSLYYLRQILDYTPETENFSFSVPDEFSEQLKNLSREELISRYIHMFTKEVRKYYSGKNNRLPVEEKKSSEKAVFRINLGKWDGLNYDGLRKELAEWTGIKQGDIFIKELNNSFSRIEIPFHAKEKILSLNHKNIEFNGRKVKTDTTEKKDFMEKKKYSGKKDFKKSGKKEKTFAGRFA